MTSRYLLPYGCLLALLLLVLGVPGFAQQQIVYLGDKGKLLSQAQLDSILSRLQQQYQAKGLVTSLAVTRNMQRHDTLFYDYAITIRSASMVQRDEHLTRFLGQPLPSFTLRDLHGKQVTSQSLRGQPLVLNLWFTTCTGCIQEMPALNQAQAAAANRGIRFIALTYDSEEKVRGFLRKRAFTFQHLPAAQAYCDLFTQEYPVTIFVDKQGIIRAIQGGLPVMDASVESAHRALAADGHSYTDTTALEEALTQIR